MAMRRQDVMKHQSQLKFKRTLWFGDEYEAAMDASLRTPLSGHAFIRECIRMAIPEVLKRYGIAANKPKGIQSNEQREDQSL